MNEEHANILSAAKRILAINEELIRIDNYKRRLRFELSLIKQKLFLSDLSGFEDEDEDIETHGIGIRRGQDMVNVFLRDDKYGGFFNQIDMVKFSLEKYEELSINRLEYPYIGLDGRGVANCFKTNPIYNSETKLWFTEEHECRYLFRVRGSIGKTNLLFIGDGLNHYSYGPFDCIAENENEVKEMASKRFRLKVNGKNLWHDADVKFLGPAKLGLTKDIWLRKPKF